MNENAVPKRFGEDLLLLALGQAAEQGVGCPVTLHIGGLLLAGMLCSAKAWRESIEKQIHTGLAGQAHNPLATEMINAVRDTAKLSEEQVLDGFLHLGAAHWLTPLGPETPEAVEGVYVRIKASSVSAWSFGVISKR